MKNIYIAIISAVFSIFCVAVNAAPSIKFAAEATYPPFVYMSPAGEVDGFDADIVHALCQQMNANCTLTNQPWESLIPSLKLGKFDAIFGGIAITPEREKQVAFTQPYYQLTGSIVANKSLNLVVSPAGLKGKTIGVQGGTTYETYLQTVYGKNIIINRYPNAQEALMDLASGRVDVMIGDTPVIQQWVAQNGKGQFVIVGKPINDEKYFGKGDAIAVRLDNTALLNALNKALTTIKANGTYCKIVHKNFGNIACHG
jgi:arginine transport system substrate-binding protein